MSAFPDPPASAPRGLLAVWRAPLVPVALAATVGIVLDRTFKVPLLWSLAAFVLALVSWIAARHRDNSPLALLYLWAGLAALGAAYHHWHREVVAEDDIGFLATADPRPVVLRGVLQSEPERLARIKDDPLRTFAARAPIHATVQVTLVRQQQDWETVSGRALLFVPGELTGLHAGDEIEIIGRLAAPQGPANPGEFDYAAFLKDQRIRAIVAVHQAPDGVTLLSQRWMQRPGAWLDVTRGWGQRTLREHLPEQYAPLAAALLLGEGSGLATQEWDKYIRTGVIHVLAISGQHLVVLAGFFWFVFRVLRVPRRRGAWLIVLVLLLYALLTGGRPPVMRAVIMMLAFCGGLAMRRQVLPANALALSWLFVAALNPTDVFNSGCQLSFLSVALLIWGGLDSGFWRKFVTLVLGEDSYTERDPLEQLLDETRPWWLRCLRWLFTQVVVAYTITFVILLAIAPLVAARYQLISPIGLLLGPPMVLLTAIALLTGFLLLLTAPVAPFLAPLFAWPTAACLAGCDWLVTVTEKWPGAYGYTDAVPGWWLWAFYLLLLALLTVEAFRRRWRWVSLACVVWLCVGLLAGAAKPQAEELRVTFLAVGHGGCTVLETPDGRTLLYDAGAMSGPDVTRRQIVPFLTQRGVRRIDEVFLSHADLDHFNGLPSLLDRFTIGQVSMTPTFSERHTPGAARTRDAIERLGVPVRILKSGDTLQAGAVRLDVLHPPLEGPDGNENARSLVLLVRHQGLTLLLTGDLEGPGLDRVLALPPMPVDVLMAPHHGSRKANSDALAAWAKPRVVVSCQGPPRSVKPVDGPYRAIGAEFLGTWPHGAITVSSNSAGWSVETFVTGQRRQFQNRDR